MAPETYYLIFSITAVFAACLYITNMVYFRIKGKTLIGNSYKPGTAEYEKLHKYSSNRSLAIVSVVALLCIANLTFDIVRLLHSADQIRARGLLVLAPVLVVVFAVMAIVKVYNQLGKGRSRKTPHKHDKDNDSWLS
jgi:glucan phosphoethanolaminetransferase (alkaline phosphatase superfamily)